MAIQTLSHDQDSALMDLMAFMLDGQPGEMVLTGKAGVGKSFLMRRLLSDLNNSTNASALQMILGTNRVPSIILAATTNKAATVLADLTGETVRTIHKVLSLKVVNDHSTGHTKVIPTKNTAPISNSLVIVDEASMVNQQLLNTIRKFTTNCKVLYVGDKYQLAPVKENISPVFTTIPEVVELTTIHRQAAGNPIIQFADKFREAQDTGMFPLIESMGSKVIHLDDTAFQAQLDSAFSDVTLFVPDKVLCWTNSKVHQYNQYIRNLNGLSSSYSVGEILVSNAPLLDEKDGTVKVQSEQIVTITNMEPVQVAGIDGYTITLNDTHRAFQATEMSHVADMSKYLAKNKKWKEFFHIKDTFLDLRPYYSSTVNKAQGSTFNNVFIDVSDIGKNTKNFEIARLLYTALTRSSDTVYMRGELPARLQP